VGRSSRRAYAYFTFRRGKAVTEIAEKRLSAIREFTTFGSGFRIAMRDLEIRGAGNILGARQHGFIAAVGFELYCRLLQEAVDEIRDEADGGAEGGKKQTLPETRLDVPLQAYIPTEFIADGSTRISIYQEMSSLGAVDELADMERGLSDRFGALPESVKALTLLMKLKILGRAAGCSKIGIGKDGSLTLCVDGNQETAKERIKSFFESSENYEFEILYDTQQVQLKTELTTTTIAQMAVETAAILERAAALTIPHILQP
jgi:transcription-repair coupling factor (superfamily II helicase)